DDFGRGERRPAFVACESAARRAADEHEGQASEIGLFRTPRVATLHGTEQLAQEWQLRGRGAESVEKHRDRCRGVREHDTPKEVRQPFALVLLLVRAPPGA